MSHAPQRPVPAPIATSRDAGGRLIGLTIESTPGLATARGNAWLVAVDGSAHSQRAVAEALRLAGTMKECTLHLVNVQHWLSKEAAEAELQNRALAATAAARALCEEAGLPWCLHAAMGEPAQGIVAVATHQGCHGIVIGSRGLGTAATLLLGSVAHEVIRLSPLPVLVVR